jgi:hypothetical protein
MMTTQKMTDIYTGFSHLTETNSFWILIVAELGCGSDFFQQTCYTPSIQPFNPRTCMRAT